MPATFIVESGAGLTNSNSYCTLAEAEQYILDFIGSAAWTAASQAAKEAALRQATRYIDACYRFQGKKVIYNQALEWPRYEVFDSSGYYIDTDKVPPKVKYACAIIALAVINGDIILPDLTTAVISSESMTVGPISSSTTYMGGKSPLKIYSLSDKMLKDFLLSGSRIERG